MAKNPPAMWETWIPSLGWEDPLEKGMATHSIILAWRIPWTESLVGYSPWGLKESDMTWQITITTPYTSQTLCGRLNMATDSLLSLPQKYSLFLQSLSVACSRVLLRPEFSRMATVLKPYNLSQDWMKLQFVMSQCKRDSVRGKVMGKKQWWWFTS